MGGEKTDLLSSLFLRRRWSWVWRGREEEHWQPRPSHPVLHPAPPGTSLGVRRGMVVAAMMAAMLVMTVTVTVT